MKSYKKLKSKIEAILGQMIEVKMKELTNILQEVKHLSKEFGFGTIILKEWIAC